MGNKTTDQSFKKTHQTVGANGNDLVDNLNEKIMKEAPGHDGVRSLNSLLLAVLSLPLTIPAVCFRPICTVLTRLIRESPLCFCRMSLSSRPVSNDRTTSRSSAISNTRATRHARPTRRPRSTPTSRRSSTSAATRPSRFNKPDPLVIQSWSASYASQDPCRTPSDRCEVYVVHIG